MRVKNFRAGARASVFLCICAGGRGTDRGRMRAMQTQVAASAALDEPAPVLPPANRPIAVWLFACCALVFAMIVVGGVTRLTHSGLSIVEWQPIIGAVQPLEDFQWQAE